MARRSDKLDAETPQVPADRSQHVEIGLIRAVAARADLAQAQRTAEDPAELAIQRRRQPHLLAAGPAEKQILAPAHRHAMVAGLGDGAVRTGLHAFRAEEAAPEVEDDALARRLADRLGRADRQAFAAALRTFRRIDTQRAAVAVG